MKREEKESEEKKLLNQFYHSFIKNLVLNFLELLEQQDYMQTELDKDFLLYAERFMELMIDLQALLPTRRYLNVLIDDLHLIVKCQMSAVLEHGDGHLFSQVSHFSTAMGQKKLVVIVWFCHNTYNLMLS